MPTPSQPSSKPPNTTPRRFTSIIRLRPEAVTEYKSLHASIWPSVAAAIKRANISDYSISHDLDTGLLFSIFKYEGEDLEGDMKMMGEDEEVRRWWDATDRLQDSLVPGATGSKDGPWWKALEEVFYLE